MLDAPTSGLVRVGDDPLTYLGLHQMYNLILELSNEALGSDYQGKFHSESGAISVISLQFREKDKQATTEVSAQLLMHHFFHGIKKLSKEDCT